MFSLFFSAVQLTFETDIGPRFGPKLVPSFWGEPLRWHNSLGHKLSRAKKRPEWVRQYLTVIAGARLAGGAAQGSYLIKGHLAVYASYQTCPRMALKLPLLCQQVYTFSRSIWMTKSIARLTLAVLALVLMGRQWTYANPDVDPAKHKRVPEPATLTLLAVGFAGVAAIRRRRKVS